MDFKIKGGVYSNKLKRTVSEWEIKTRSKKFSFQHGTDEVVRDLLEDVKKC